MERIIFGSEYFYNEGEKRAKCDYIRDETLQISIRSSVARIWFPKRLGKQLIIWELFGHSNQNNDEA